MAGKAACTPPCDDRNSDPRPRSAPHFLTSVLDTLGLLMSLPGPTDCASCWIFGVRFSRDREGQLDVGRTRFIEP